MRIALAIVILWALGESAHSASTEIRLRQLQACQNDVRYLLDAQPNMLPAYMALLRDDCH